MTAFTDGRPYMSWCVARGAAAPLNSSLDSSFKLHLFNRACRFFQRLKRYYGREEYITEETV